MHDITADCHSEPVKSAFVTTDGECIQKRLGGVLMAAIASIDYRAINVIGEEAHCARVRMADDDDVGMHGIQCHRRVDQRLTLFYSRGSDRNIDDISPEAFPREFERGTRAGRGFKKE